MSLHDTNQKTGVRAEGERRARHDLRLIFQGACGVTASCFGLTLGQGNVSLPTSARRALHEAYPELSMQEVSILFSAVERFHKMSRSQ